MTAFEPTPRTHDVKHTNDTLMADDQKSEPYLPKATSLLFNSGNVVSSDRLKKRTNLNPQDELNEVLNNALSCWASTPNASQVRENKSVKCRHPELYERIDENEKKDMSISIKIFLTNLDPEVINQAVKTILDEIGADCIDTLIISFPDKIFNHDELPYDLVMPVWNVVQGYIDTRQILSAGLSDFNAKYMEQFMNALEDKNRKPSLNQVNLTSCCKMPEDLVEYAKINNIQLTTHIDPRELLGAETLQTIVKKHLHEYDAHGWINLWVARYTLILKGRGIVKSKGYIVNSQRELKYTK